MTSDDKDGSQLRVVPDVHQPSLVRPLLITAIGMLLGMVAVDQLQSRLFPMLTHRQTTVTTIFCSTLVAMAVIYLVLRRYQTVQHAGDLARVTLYQSDMQLTEAQTLARVGSWTADIATGTEVWSDELYRIYGLEPHSQPSSIEAFMPIVHPEDRAEVMAMIKRTSQQAGAFSQEYRIVRPDGAVRFIADQARVLVDARGIPTWVVGASQDITERKQAEQGLAEREQRYRQMFEGNLSVQWLIDPVTGAIVEANPAASAFYGYSVDELQHMNITAINISLDLQAFRAVAQGVSSTAGALTFRHKLASGAVRDVEVHSGPIDVGGRLLLYSIIHDVTERNQAAERLRKSEALYRTLVRNLPKCAVLLFDADLRFQLVDGTALEAHAYSKESVEGKTLWEVLPPDKSTDLEPYYRATLIGQTQMIEREYAGLWYLIQFLPVKTEEDVPFAGLVVALDITEQRQAEAARHARLLAEQANRAKGEFLSRMSHELRTPLNAILGFAQVLEMDGLAPLQQESVDQILTGGRHLLTLINEVLDITGIESGHLALSLEPLEIVHLVAEVNDLMVPIAAHYHVTVNAAPDPGCEWHVLADRHRLRQVLLNLLSNAIKYNCTGGSVHVRCGAATDDRLRLDVRDTGAGIAAALLPRLFTPFERLDAAQTSIEGTGLGLALSKRLMEAMGGSIGVDSVVGVGSTFWIELPLIVVPADPVGLLPVLKASNLPEPLVQSSRKLLYIEDNLSNVRLIEKVLLRRPHISLLTAMQGRLGLDLAKEHHPDLILLDVQLPDIHGDEVLRQLRTNPATRDIPVMLLSADANPRRSEQFLQAGAVAYLTKPLDIAQFLALVDDTLNALDPTGG